MTDPRRLLSFFGVGDSMDLPNAVMGVVLSPQPERDAVYRCFFEEFGYDVGRDWFRELYEAELAERKQKGQDFTAPEVSELLAELSGADGSVHEPTAGTGGLLIAAWNRARTAVLPWEFFPSQHMVDCWELSGRSVPILLFNLSIRGIMGYVHHGDVLEQKAVMHYVLLNRSDDALGFSEIIKDPEGRMRIVQDI